MPLPWLTLAFLHNCNNSYHSCLTLFLPQVWEGFLTVSGANYLINCVFAIHSRMNMEVDPPLVYIPIAL